ncbi:hypothetical protein [uncultured Nitratireductor sp.]|uniref:hypothetical protein n=1 Tax=uncultured Nitratireductor sp. TaxID=520953 RepID=UPI002626712C|nr:hypothetical protein [uncultured Nitratireductor sp.]
MRTHISADLGRFLLAGIANSALTSAIYFICLFALNPTFSYAVAWGVGLIFVMWFYPDRVFVGSCAGTNLRVALGLLVASVFFAGVGILQLVLLATERPDIAFVVALASTVVLNFIFGRLVMRTQILRHIDVERFVQVIFVALPLACLFWMSLQWLKFGIDLPYRDDWRDYASGNIGSLSLAYLFQPENDTIYIIGKILDSFAVRVLDGNSVAYQFLSMITILGLLLALQWHLLKAVLSDRLLCAAAFSITILMIQPGSYWGLQNLAYHQAIPLVCLLASCNVIFVQRWHWIARSAVLFLLGIISGFSYISGALATLSVALTLTTCIVANRRALLALAPDAMAILLAGLITTAVQVRAILLYQDGSIHTGTAWALPTEADFWLYLLGKIAQSLMLPSTYPLISIVVVAAICAVSLFIAAFSLYSVAVIDEMNNSKARARLLTLLLLTAVSSYLVIVAAGRANLRGEHIESPLQIFSFGFHRFHFFWATVIWPWIFLGIAHFCSCKKLRTHRWLFAAAAGAIVTFATSQGVFQHSSYFRHTSQQASENAECLRLSLLEGRDLFCPGLYPVKLNTAYANAVKHGASFVRYFPPSLISVSEAPINVLEEPSGLDVRNTSFSITESGGVMISAGWDAQVIFSVATIPEDCFALRVSAEIDGGKSDMAQIFYQTKKQQFFAGSRSQKRLLTAESRSLVEFTIVSSDGFGTHFRLDPTFAPKEITLQRLEISCAMRSS